MENKIDESLYSRQLYAIGLDAMTKITESSVLISCKYNFSGSAIELVKCVVLAGLKRVTLHANKDILTYRDLSSNYYVSPKDIGKPFIKKVAKRIADLNHYVNVGYCNLITDTLINEYNCVVFCDYDVNELYDWNIKCRTNGVKFIMLQSFGLLFNMFCDFGDKHVVADIDGEPINSGIVESIIKNKFRTFDLHNIYSGDVIYFEGNVDGLISKTDREPNLYLVNIINAHEFELREFLEIHKQMSHGERQIVILRTDPIAFPDSKPVNLIFKQIKLPVTFIFRSLEESLKTPEFAMIDNVDYDMPKILNVFMKALGIWRSDCKHIDVLAFPMSDQEIDSLKKIFDLEINNSKFDKVFELLAKTCYGSICGIDAIAGSICAQEVIKAVTNKFTPTKQFLHFESLNVLPDNYIEDRRTNKHLYTPTNSRYDGQIVVFGSDYMNLLHSKNIFVVGAGAIGCEHIKNFSMMGVNKIIITDMDHIEKSNLNRQFLFRHSDINQPKSMTAAKKGKKINCDVDIIAHKNKVCDETNNIYNSDFFKSIDIVANALDNVESRVFVDSLCIKYRKPLLECGTQGTKGSIQTIIPDLTESYGSFSDQPEQTVATCTLKMFPYKYEHVVQYAIDSFEGLFNRVPSNYIKAKNPENLKTLSPSEISEILNDVTIIANNSNNFKCCVNFAYKQWHNVFRDPVVQIVKKYPENYVDEDGNRFWSGNKMFPTIHEFDIRNNSHIEFVIAFAHIWADVLNIPKEKQIGNINAILSKKVPPNIPKNAECRIAGKIIPAIATTTSVVSGFVALELYKTIYGQLNKTYNTIQKYRYGSFNLAVQLFSFGESYPAKLTNIDGKLYSIWTQINVDPDKTLGELLNEWNSVLLIEKNTQTQMSIDFIFDGDKIIYSKFDELSDNYDSQSIRDLIIKYNPEAKHDHYLSISLGSDAGIDNDCGYTPCINKKIGNYSELYDQITNRNPNNTAKYAESKLALVGSPVPSFYDFNNMNLYQKGPYLD
nr:ubiquitin-activating enzyme E1 1-like [Hydra vulgaris]